MFNYYLQDQEENNESDLESNDDNKQEQPPQPSQTQQSSKADGSANEQQKPQEQQQQPDNKTANYPQLSTVPTIGGWPAPTSTPTSTPAPATNSAALDGNAIPRLTRQLFGAYISTGGSSSGNTVPATGSVGGSGSGANSETESSAQEIANADSIINGLNNSLDHIKLSMEKVIN